MGSGTVVAFLPIPKQDTEFANIDAINAGHWGNLTKKLQLLRHIYIEDTESQTALRDSMADESLASAFSGSFITPLDKDYIESLARLGYKDEARAKLDELYEGRRRDSGTLFTPEERECFEALVKAKQMEEAERALELAYRKRKDLDGDGLAPSDREYIEMLEALGAKDAVEKVRSRGKKKEPEANGGPLLKGIDKEYVDSLVRIGSREKARKIVDSIYSKRKDVEQSMMMDLLERARKK